MSAVFDPWSASPTEAMRAHEEHDACSALPDPLVQYQVAQEVLGAREECQAPTGGCAVLRCLQRCFLHALRPPQWLVDAFGLRYSMVMEAAVGSWDEAFGHPWPPGTRLATVRRHRFLKKAIHSAAFDRVTAGATVNRDLFEQIGELKGICVSGSTAEKLYLQALHEGYPNPVQLRAASGVIPRTARKDGDDFLSEVTIIASFQSHEDQPCKS